MALNLKIGFEPNRLSFVFNNMVASNRIFNIFFCLVLFQSPFGPVGYGYALD